MKLIDLVIGSLTKVFMSLVVLLLIIQALLGLPNFKGFLNYAITLEERVASNRRFFEEERMVQVSLDSDSESMVSVLLNGNFIEKLSSGKTLTLLFNKGDILELDGRGTRAHGTINLNGYSLPLKPDIIHITSHFIEKKLVNQR